MDSSPSARGSPKAWQGLGPQRSQVGPAVVQQERGPREPEREAPLSGCQALTRRDLKHQAGRETRGQEVLEPLIQTCSWEETRKCRITWALGSGPPQAGEEAGMGEQGAVQDPGPESETTQQSWREVASGVPGSWECGRGTEGCKYQRRGRDTGSKGSSGT